MSETFYHNLSNGLQIVHRKTTSPVVYVGIMVGAGTRHETNDVNGLAHYIEHCVFKGTQHYTARQIINNIESVGADINAYTTKEETTFYAATLCQHFRKTIHLLADIVLRPTFPKKETDKEVSVILDEIESYNDSPSELIFDDFENFIFDGTSLALPILGTKKSLNRISRSPDVALNWMNQHYRPERMVLFVLGNISTKQIILSAEREFLFDSRLLSLDTAPSNSVAPDSPLGVQYPIVTSQVSNIEASRVRIYRRHTHQTHIIIGTRAYALGDSNYLPLYFLNNILGGGGLSSRLNLTLREKFGLVYTVESQLVPLSDTGYWCIYLACEPPHKDHCLELCHKELKQLRDTKLTSAQFQRSLRQLKGQMAIAAENQENNALAMAKQMLYFHHAPMWYESYEKIAQITPQKLQDIANEMYQPEQIHTLMYD